MKDKTKVKRRNELLLMLCSVFGCSEASPKQIIFNGRDYLIPLADVEAYIPADQGQAYARISPPERKFVLVLAETDRIARNWQGPEAPLVTHINDVPNKMFESFVFSGGVTICKSDIGHRNCGLRVYFDGVGWAVLFAKDDVANSEVLRNEALSVIKGYREAAIARGN